VVQNLVIIPTYNEKDNIINLTKTILGLPEKFHILVIDDNSPDGTAGVVENLQDEFPDQLFLLKREGKLGLGTAYITGFKWAIERKYEYIFQMDADFSHDPSDLPRLLSTCREGADLAIGSRYVSGVNVINWPIGRILMSYFASRYVRFITCMKIYDTTAGFKCYKRKVLEAIDLDSIKFKGYAFQIEMKFNAWKMGFNIVEIPIIFTERKHGVSKMSGGIFNEALWGVILMKVKSLFKKYKKKEHKK